MLQYAALHCAATYCAVFHSTAAVYKMSKCKCSFIGEHSWQRLHTMCYKNAKDPAGRMDTNYNNAVQSESSSIN